MSFFSEQFEKSLSSLNQCTALAPDDSNIWFNIGCISTQYALASLEKAQSDTRYLKVQVVQKSIDLFKSSRVLFQKAYDVAKVAEESVNHEEETMNILYTSKTAQEYMQSISKEKGEGGEGGDDEEDDWLTMAGKYLVAANDQEGKNQEILEATRQQLKDEDARKKVVQENQQQEELEERNKREQRARDMTAKAAEQNVQEAKEAKIHKERRKQARSRPKRKRDVGELLGEESRSEDSESSESSGSDSDSEDEMGSSSSSSSKKAASQPAKKRAKLSATAAAIFSDSDSDSDDEMIGSGSAVGGVEGAAGGGAAGGAAGAAAAPVAPSKGLLDDSDEDD